MRNISRCAALASLILVACSFAPGQYRYAPPAPLSDGIKVGTLMEAGLDEAKLTAGTNEILKGTYPNVHSLLIFRRGKLVYENYFTGEDRERGVGEIGVVKHTRDTLHDIRSVTKSVVGLAVLHAFSTGKIKSLDESVFDIFPEFAEHALGDKRLITIRHMLTMTSGLEWDEKISYADPKNSEFAMNDSPQPIEFVLKQKLVAAPGSTLNYSGGSTQLLAEILRKKAGLPVDEYTQKYIFAPLGITAYKWVNIEGGQPSAASGLRLRSRDMAKLGLLVMNKGKWNGQRILPERVIAEATQMHADMKDKPDEMFLGMGYGYQIWLERYRFNGVPVSAVFFSGNGGQFVIMDRRNDIMMVTTAGNYNTRDLPKGSWWLFPDIVFPSIIRPKSS